MTRSYASLGLAAALSSVLLLAGCGGSDNGAAAQAPGAATVPPSSAAGANSGAGGAADQNSGSDGTGNGAGTGNGDAGQARQPAQSSNPSGGYWPATVQLGRNPRLGSVVVDGEGFTLYRFDPDSARPSKATCVGDCAVTWPPVLVNDKITFRGLERYKISNVTRPDGTQQLTIGGWPAYRFSKDKSAGETSGEGVGGTWFTLAPDGTKAKDS